MSSATLRLRDGRRLGYAQFGVPSGRPVLLFHGGSDSRLTRHPDDTIVESLGIRLVTIDRPGIGLSDYAPRRSLVGWVEDVEQLADSLGLEGFAVVGWSAGGPHALACAYILPDRVRRIAVVAGLPPLDANGAVAALPPFMRRLFVLARISPLLAWPALGFVLSRTRGDLDRVAARYNEYLSECDREVLAQPGILEAAILAKREAHARGLASELTLLTKPWGFPLAEVRAPTTLWYGTEDLGCPPRVAEALAAQLPDARVEIVQGQGHQLFYSRWREIMADVSA